MPKVRTLDEFEKAYTDGIGQALPPRDWITVTEERLGRFAEGAGDYNPLYREPDYAASGRYHSLVAPPAWVMVNGAGQSAAIWGLIPPGDVSTEDLTMLYAGFEVDWLKPIYVGDRIRLIERPVAARRISTTQIPDAVLTSAEAEYWNGRAEVAARVRCQMIRFPTPDGGVASTADRQAPTIRVAPDPLVHQRTRRGAEPRYWDDVTEGEELSPLEKGTYTLTELYMFYYATGSPHRAAQMDGNTIDMGAGGRADPEYARQRRAQATSFDFGFQRACWLIQAASDWAGDYGDLVTLTGRIRRPNLLFDTNTIYGHVAKKIERDGDKLVELDLRNINQDAEVTATATVTVRLPVKGGIPDHSLLFSTPRKVAPSGPYG